VPATEDVKRAATVPQTPLDPARAGSMLAGNGTTPAGTPCGGVFKKNVVFDRNHDCGAPNCDAATVTAKCDSVLLPAVQRLTILFTCHSHLKLGLIVALQGAMNTLSHL
jgi:hypothetical protein